MQKPVLVAAPSKARTIFDRSNTGIVGSNPARDMDLVLQAGGWAGADDPTL
jgi:hypothetical protein